MPPAFVQGKGNTTNTASPAPLAFTSNNTAGNLLVVVGRNNGNVSPTIADTQGNTWVLLIQDNWRANNSFFVYYALNCKAGANTITLTAASTLISFSIAEFSGVQAVSALDQSTFTDTGLGTWTAIDSGGITPTKAGDLIVGVQGNGTSATTVSLGSGYTNLVHDSANTSSIESQVQSSIAGVHGTFTASSGVSGGAAVLAFFAKSFGSNQLMLTGAGT
jgi:hypothetical protein